MGALGRVVTSSQNRHQALQPGQTLSWASSDHLPWLPSHLALSHGAGESFPFSDCSIFPWLLSSHGDCFLSTIKESSLNIRNKASDSCEWEREHLCLFPQLFAMSSASLMPCSGRGLAQTGVGPHVFTSCQRDLSFLRLLREFYDLNIPIRHHP